VVQETVHQPQQASRLFKSGGVTFDGEEYGEGLCLRISTTAASKTTEWENGRTYWPNKKRVLHT
jgi:hypothetical protein